MLQTFTNRRLGNVDIIMENDKPYFDATKVANILGYSNTHSAISRHCKEPGIMFREVLPSIRKYGGYMIDIANTIAGCDDSISIGAFAKLREERYIC